MPRARPTLRALVFLSLAVSSAACDDPPSADDTPDVHPERNDVGPCGPTPVVLCLPGAIGRTCGEGSVLMTCADDLWRCPEGTVVPTDCGCRAGSTDGGPARASGDPCSSKDAGSDAPDVSDSDAGDEADSDASDGD
ncbi:MAG: hypothetical protein ABI175_14545 [Polyangiales bacterium]